MERTDQSCRVQVMFAFFYGVFQGSAPDINLDNVRNRVVGILCGLLVTGLVFQLSGPSARLIEPKIQRELAETAHYGLRHDFSSRGLRWSDHQRATICLTPLLWRTARIFPRLG
jgi:hypothetical protein